MKSFVFTLALTAIIGVLGAFRVTAQEVYTYSDIYYYPPTNKMYGYILTEVTYGTQVYYCPDAIGSIFNTTANTADTRGVDYPIDCSAVQQDTSALVQPELPYDPNAEYHAEGYHSVRPYFVADDGIYIDYYKLIEYMRGFPIYQPWFYGFLGAGAQENISESSVPLGQTYVHWEFGEKAGPPHHLKILSDSISDVTSDDPSEACGQIKRKIKWQVVDESGRSAGKTAYGERPATIPTNPCTGNQVSLTPCSRIIQGVFKPNYTDNNGKFDDFIAIGCPAPFDSCGFRIDPNVWVNCNFTRTEQNPIPLATIIYDVRKRAITVGGRPTSYPPKTEVFANGDIVIP